MDWDLKITDLEGSTPEHSAVIVNFVAAVRHQLKNSTCYVYSDNVQYRFKDNQGNNKIVIPDASINCRTKSRRGNTFTDAPRFVMEVLSPSTENYDRTEKMQLYCEQEIEEYWIVDWRKKTVEIYELDYEGEIPGYSPRDCGNYLDNNLTLAKIYMKKYKEEVLDNPVPERLHYPQ